MGGGVESKFGGEDKGVEITATGVGEGCCEGCDLLFCCLLLLSLVVVGDFGGLVVELEKKKNMRKNEEKKEKGRREVGERRGGKGTSVR